MARKTAVHTTNAEVAAAEYAADARKDRAATGVPTGLVSLAALRERRGIMTERALLKRAQDAARLELRGENYGADDRADVAATIIADVLAENHGTPPRSESPKATLTAFCDRAKTLRRSLQRQRARDDSDAQRAAESHALSADALGADSTPAKHAAIVGRSSADAAARAASAICAELKLPDEDKSPHWTLFYVWARGESPEVCAAERGVSFAAWRVRQTRGAKFVRGFYGASELLTRLTLGAATRSNGLVYVLRDDSHKARDRTRLLADVSMRPDGATLGGQVVFHWRESPAVPAPISRREDASIRVHHMTAKKARGDVLQHRADAHRNMARAAAAGSRREKASKRVSDLARGMRQDRAA